MGTHAHAPHYATPGNQWDMDERAQIFVTEHAWRCDSGAGWDNHNLTMIHDTPAGTIQKAKLGA